MDEAETNPATEATRVAVECLTLWLEPGPVARQRAAEHITALRHRDHPESADQIIVGLLNLGMLLVVDLAIERGAGEEDALEKAGDILRRLSPRLPQ